MMFKELAMGVGLEGCYQLALLGAKQLGITILVEAEKTDPATARTTWLAMAQQNPIKMSVLIDHAYKTVR